MLSPSSENPRHMISPQLTPMTVTTHGLVAWLNVPVWCPPLDCECLRTRDQSISATVILIVLSPVSNTWHVYSNNLFKKINKDVGLSLSVPSNVGGVMRGSYNSLMFGNAIETTFYRLELGKDVRMWSFYCKNISANLLGEAKPFLKTQQLVLILRKKVSI